MDEIGAKKPKPEFLLRVISGVILAGFVIGVTWIGGLSFKLFAAVLSFFILLEYSQIVSASSGVVARWLAFGFLGLSIVAWFTGDNDYAFGMVAIGVIALALYEISKGKRPWMAPGLLYAILPLFALAILRGNDVSGLHIMIILFLCVWSADSFGYLVGKPVGGPRLAPRISPNKTWSGFLGGTIGAIGIASLAAWALGYKLGGAFIFFALCVAIISQVGDLVESALKRQFNKKDSGHIIPGHGGVLDRIDGLIFAVIGVWIVASVLTSTADDNISKPLMDIILSPLSSD
ncbi:MAG: phosphatidate cytidylyltransferase [Rhizobiaceae bacterium]